MRTTTVISSFVLLALAVPSFAVLPPTHPKVVAHASAAVDTDTITLGDIAEITPSPQASKASARLAATVLGRAALPGTSRPLTRGDIMLKLRQAGINPSTIDLEGAENIVVTSQGANAASARTASAAAPVAAPAAQPKPDAPAVRAGDPVDVMLVDGPVTVHAKGYAASSGAIGDTIPVRRDNADHPLSAIIIAAGQVQLEE